MGRPRARIRLDAGQRRPHLRRQHRNHLSARRRRAADRHNPRHSFRDGGGPEGALRSPAQGGFGVRPHDGDRDGRARCRRADGKRLRRYGRLHRRAGNRHPRLPAGADAQEQSGGRRARNRAPGNTALHRKADRARRQFRRAGRHRNRERAAPQRSAGAHRRPFAIAGAADRDLRYLAHHRCLARRRRRHAAQDRRNHRTAIRRRRRLFPPDGRRRIQNGDRHWSGCGANQHHAV